MNLSGEIAAILTALSWTFGSLFFTFSGRRVSSATVNRIRLWMALILLMGIHIFMFDTLFPYDANPSRFFWLGLSGLIGYAAGDAMLFESFVLIGPRLAMLLMTLVPIFGSILAWIFLGEHLALIEILAILITLSGIVWVVGEKKISINPNSSHFGPGILHGIGGALGQAIGLLFAKKGLVGDFSAVSANLIRVTAASIGIGLISVFRGGIVIHLKKLTDRKALIQLIFASLLGPVIGVVLSLYAIAHTEIGVASTLMSLSPLFLIPLSRIFFKETITYRAIVGTVIALAGSVIFFFR